MSQDQSPRNAALTETWRSLSEFEGDEQVAEFAKREFPTDDFDRIESPDRRRFMQILGASAALAGASSCRWEKEEILPFGVRPEDAVPGKKVVYSTVMDLAGCARPVRVESFDGRPVKVEPNEATGGGTDLFSQAATLGFYDPDRSRAVKHGDKRAAWSDALDALRSAAGGGKAAVLASTSSSPTLHRLAAAASEAGVRWTWYSPLDRENSIEGARTAFGDAHRVRFDLTQADVVLALDSDFQRDHADAVNLARDLGSRRLPEEGAMSRIYAVEARFTSSGLSSDHRLPLRASDVGSFLELVDAKMGGRAPSAAASALVSKRAVVGTFADAVAADLNAAGARIALLVGESQPAAVHARALQMMARQGAAGTTMFATEEPLAGAGSAALASLVDAMKAGDVDTLLMLEGNPVYDAPADLGFTDAMANVANVAHLSLYADETSSAVLAQGGWHLPAAHWLECWGDARSFDGTIHLAQPLIAPLYGGKSAVEVVGAMLGELAGDGAASGEDLVRATFMGLPDSVGAMAGDRDAAWRRSLHDGAVEGSAFATQSVSASGASVEVPAGADGLELNLFPCPKVLDGRFANNGWLQELPDAVTKLTWDNAIYLGVKTAAAMGLKTGSKAKLAANGAELEAAVYVMAGHAEDSASLALGYGRTSAGVIAGFKAADVASAGFNAYPMRKTAAPSIVAGATLTKARGSYELATTQEHHLIDAIGMSGRAQRLPILAREGSIQEWEGDHEFAKHRLHLPPHMRSLFDQEIYDGEHQWSMTIDLAQCNGCNACVVACQSENNVPIVGKEQVLRGREMHWMRVDFYFQGDAQEADTVDAVGQPVNCLQCENAPCEQVCPVAATVHSQEGLNDMVYNRCIGTRYCGNNCPVKVRRFNYFHYTKFMDKPGNKVLQLAQNPEVTVRSRGVMEKCTYCVQRISKARINARNKGRQVQDGEVVTACQSACPPNAITFGNMLDETAAVSKKRSEPRAYAMLEELNIRPRTLYMAKVSNLNETLAGTWDKDAHAHKDGAMPQGQYAAGTIPAHHGGHDAGYENHGDTLPAGNDHGAENGGGH